MSSPFLNLPSNHPVPPTTALYVRALYDYESNSASSISFRAGDLIRVLNRLDSGWWDGILDDVRGWFPSNYTVIVAEDSIDPDDDVHLRSLTGSLQHDQIYEEDEGGDDEEEGEKGRTVASSSQDDSHRGRRQHVGHYDSQQKEWEIQRGQQEREHRRRRSEVLGEEPPIDDEDKPEQSQEQQQEEKQQEHQQERQQGGQQHQHQQLQQLQQQKPQQFDPNNDSQFENGDAVDREQASWVPQVTQQGQLFYFNRLTGKSTVDLNPDGFDPSLSSASKANRNTITPASAAAAAFLQKQQTADASRPVGHTATSSSASNRIPPESLVAGIDHDEAADGSTRSESARNSIVVNPHIAHLISSNSSIAASGTGLDDESTLVGNTTITPANAGANAGAGASVSVTVANGNGNISSRRASVTTIDTIQKSETVKESRSAATTDWITSSESASTTSSSSDNGKLSPRARPTLAAEIGSAVEGLRSQVTVVPETASNTTTTGAQMGANPAVAFNSPNGSKNSLHFLPDTHMAIHPTWQTILAYTRSSVAQYRLAVKSRKLSLYIPLVENISDQLRFLLAAASDTTDNHSGTPSVISGNKELSPEFRNMMSRFSKMVVNSHLAISAAEWIGRPSASSLPTEEGIQNGSVNGASVEASNAQPLLDAEMKCIAESHGFEEAMERFIEKARELRGEHVVQLIPAFIAGSSKAGSGICVGGNWSGNGVFHERRGDASRAASIVRRRKMSKKERKEREMATSAFLEMGDDDDDDDEEDEKTGITSSADRENTGNASDGHAAGHGTVYESHGDDGDVSRGEESFYDESFQRESSSDDYGYDHEYHESSGMDSHFDSLTDDDDDNGDFDDGYGFADEDDGDESSDLGLDLGGDTSSAESNDQEVMSGAENCRPPRYNPSNRPRPNRAYTNDTAEGSESATTGLDLDGKTRRPYTAHHDDYDTDASSASVAAAAAAADSAVRNRMGRGRSRTNTLGGQPGARANAPAPITVFGGRSASGSNNRNTMIIEGHAGQDHDVDSTATDGEVDLTEEAKKKLSSRRAGPRSARGRGPIRSKRVCPRPRVRLTPRTLQKFTPLRTSLESALRKLDTSTVTGCEGIGGTSNRASTAVPQRPPLKTGDDEGDFGSGMASPSLTLTSSMSSMSMSNPLSTHTPMTLTIAGRDALAERVCAAAAEVLKSFQPLAKLLESFNLKGLVDDAFLESLHGGGSVPGSGNPAPARTGPESNPGSSPGSANGNPPPGNAFTNFEKSHTPKVIVGEDAFGNPILGQSTGTCTPTAWSHYFSYSPHTNALQSPSLNSPSASTGSLNVPFGEPSASILLPSPASGVAGSTKAQVRPLTQAEALADAFSYKQRLYDAIGALVLAAQAIGAPLADEWSTVSDEVSSQGGFTGDSPIQGTSLEAMDSRIGMLRGTVGMVKGILEQLTIALQTLLGFGVVVEQARRRTLMARRQGMGGPPSGRNSTAARVSRAAGSVDMRMAPATEPAEPKGPKKGRMIKMNVQPRMDKANRFFGEPTPTTPTHKAGGANPEPLTSRVPPPAVPGSAGLSGGFSGAAVASPTNATPWFLRCDHEAEVVYEEKDGIVMLKAGSLLGLVEQLTRHDKLDTSFHSTFLLTYRSFTTATELFEHLMHRFTLPPPLGLLDEAEHALWTRMKQGPIRIRVVNTLKTWLENYWMEPNDDCEDGPTSRLLRNIQTFVQNAVFPTKTPGASQLLTLVEKRLQMGLEGKDQQIAMGRKMTPHIKSAPTPLWPKNTKKVKLLDINPEEMARQLSLIEIKLYARIKPTECLNKTWTKKSKNPDDTQNYAPNVKAMIRHSNQLTNWVAETILRQGDVKRRVAVIKFFTNVADRCGKMNNYSSLMTIISALATAPIDRLGRTWYQVSARTMATLERLRTLMQTTKNFALYRQTLHNVNPPCIPFLGIYLTDLIFTEDGIPSTADKSMINFSKWRKTAAVIQEIQQFQNGTYQFQPVPELQEWILQQMREAQDCSTKVAYDRSLEIEPREREDEKITRLLSESGFL